MALNNQNEQYMIMQQQKAPYISGTDQAVSGRDGSALCRNSFTNALRSQSCIVWWWTDFISCYEYMNAFEATP